MKRIDKIALFKNVGSSWFALGVNILAGLFLSPYILHHLGDEAFGLWVLIFSVTGYYGLFDLGIRSSIIRYVAKYHTVAQNDELNRLINTALFSYSIAPFADLLWMETKTANLADARRFAGGHPCRVPLQDARVQPVTIVQLGHDWDE